MKFKYKPKSTKYERNGNEGVKSTSSLEFRKISGVNPKVSRNNDNKENIRDTNSSNLSTNIGNLSKISSIATPTANSSVTKLGHNIKGNNNLKKEVSHIKNISMDNTNSLDHNILEFLDNKLINNNEPVKSKLSRPSANFKHKERERESVVTPREKVKESRKSSTHYDGFYDHGKKISTPVVNNIN